MALLDWCERYSVNSPAMDQQHRKLFDLINQLHDAMKRGEAKAMTARALEELVSYTRTHFAAEERTMAAAAYPDLAAHVAEHRKLTDTVERLNHEVKAGTMGLSVELMEFLQHWLTNHIMQVDKKYSPFVNA